MNSDSYPRPKRTTQFIGRCRENCEIDRSEPIDRFVSWETPSWYSVVPKVFTVRDHIWNFRYPIDRS